MTRGCSLLHPLKMEAAQRGGRRPVPAFSGVLERLRQMAAELMEMAMMKRSVFDEVDHSLSWEVVSAWAVVILLLVATSIGLLLDRAVAVVP
jgi:hypothetical protein